MSKTIYIYHGDKMAKALRSPFLKQKCTAIRKENGKCIRGRNSNMLVEFQGGKKVVVLARMLRKLST